MKVKRLIKLIISLILLALVLRLADLRALKETLLAIPVSTAITVVLGYLAGQVLSSYKWWRIAKAGGIDVPYSVALKSYFIGMFVNSFGMGLVGGDVARGVLLAHGKQVKTAALASVVADRAQGLAVLALLGTLSAALLEPHGMHPDLVFILLAIGVVILCGWFAGPKLLLKFVKPGNKLRDKAEQVSKMFPHKRSEFIIITTLSITFHLLQIALHWVMAHGIGIEISFGTLLVAIPFVNMFSSLPISWNGLGVREYSYATFLSGIITNEQAVALGAIWLVAITITSAIGGIVAFITKDFSVYLKKESLASSA
ncbi:MAG: UPF0104 family protein [Candidatus Dadabacteria bacterium]|nr:MAG: UPF0104 family protein [Candidatus Dadabacteria bacterium]